MVRFLGRYRYTILVTVLIAGLWTMAWAKEQTDRADRSFWPAEHPELFQWEPVK
jgi:hypothetical protein